MRSALPLRGNLKIREPRVDIEKPHLWNRASCVFGLALLPQLLDLHPLRLVLLLLLFYLSLFSSKSMRPSERNTSADGRKEF
jgi:hypothetical protein